MHQAQAHSDIELFSADLTALVEHLQHVLPGQAPLEDFVHHNTLHGLQHLPFPDAVRKADQQYGYYGYLSAKQFRQHYQNGRINADDLYTVLAEQSESWQMDTVLFSQKHLKKQQDIRFANIYHAALVYPIKPLSESQLVWQIEENKIFETFIATVPDAQQKQLLAAAKATKPQQALEDLWSACLAALHLPHTHFHVEELSNLLPEHAEHLFANVSNKAFDTNHNEQQVHQQFKTQAESLANDLFSRVGKQWTLSEFVCRLTGEDVRSVYDPLLIRAVSAWLDQGIAAWQLDDASASSGFYRIWKMNTRGDLNGLLEDMPDCYEQIESLPNDATTTINRLLTRMGIPQQDWMQYLEILALELPGWAGMFLWRQQHPHYEGLKRPVELVDYLAVRLVMEYLFVQRVCREQWLVNASLFDIKTWFSRHAAELYVCYYLFKGELPEYLISQAQDLRLRTQPLDDRHRSWEYLAQRLWTWEHSPAAKRSNGYSVPYSGWRLFSLMQHLGICADTVSRLSTTDIKTLFTLLRRVDDRNTRGFIWLQAYESHYRDEIFNAVVNNKENAANWSRKEASRPEAQLVFCMDDREESIRRHIEELNPQIETLGAAAFFNVVMNWKGVDDAHVTKLCPVVATPVHRIDEVPQQGLEKQQRQHDYRRGKRLRLQHIFHQETRRNSLLTTALMLLGTPLTALVLLGKVFAPLRFSRYSQKVQTAIDLPLKTQINVSADELLEDRAPDHNQWGFTDEEQAQRVEGFLRNMGLIEGFAPLVAIIGHGSTSVNNPHEAAHDCGACSGRHSGPNARVFSAMANRPQVRKLLAKKGIVIPDDCWFLGSQHNTADEKITWYDMDDMPNSLKTAFNDLQQTMDKATYYSAHERCRKFASAPKQPSLTQAYDHVVERSQDISQVRPELGHATNAVAFIGRRALSRGVFFDRRSFLISYDYSSDADGVLLEGILLSAGPVGAGINLEYYFSTVNNENYGCGSKTAHNLTGLFGIMEGASSDLRTGLPWQMADIHEAMRLQVLVEAKVEVVTAIYLRQPPLQELVGKGWILLSVKDPDTHEIHLFNPDKGFLAWQGKVSPLPQVTRSTDWYSGHYDHLPPATITIGDNKKAQGGKEASHA